MVDLPVVGEQVVHRSLDKARPRLSAAAIVSSEFCDGSVDRRRWMEDYLRSVLAFVLVLIHIAT